MTTTVRSRARLLLGFAAAATALAAAAPAEAATTFSYYVGIDDFPSLTSGTYSGLPNPNHNRLTFLWAHFDDVSPSSNHYHSKGIYAYTGPAAGPTVVTSTSNYVPEGTNPPLRLAPGTGTYAGKLVTRPYADTTEPSYHFSGLTIGSTRSLSAAAPGTGEHFMFTSSVGRWDSAFDAADVHLELVSLTPGLNVGGTGAASVGLNAPGNDLHLGEGTEQFTFTPVLWTDAAATPGVYEAAFKLTDGSGTFGDSGVFRVRTEVVPEPATAGVALAGGLLAGLARRRRRAVRRDAKTGGRAAAGVRSAPAAVAIAPDLR